MAPTRHEFHEFLAAHFPETLPAAGCTAQADLSGSEPLFVEDRCIRAWARAQGQPVPEALPEVMAALLDLDVWPERFRQNCGAYTARQMQCLLRTRVAIAGAGGLGGHVTALLARLGVCHFTLCDRDVFSESNLNRQAFCTQKVLGCPKVDVAAGFVADIADYARVRPLALTLNDDTMPDFLAGADLVFDCLDNLATKMQLEKACQTAGLPFVHGGVSLQEGLALASPAHGPAGLSLLYGESAPEQPARQPVSVLAVTGTACMMVSLGLRVLFGHMDNRKDARAKNPNGGQQGGTLTPLYHLDCGQLELETFELGS